MRSNWRLADAIREYWEIRAKTYDRSMGHGLIDGAEAASWRALLHRHLGAGNARAALDLGCGTGPIALLLHQSGFQVTGADVAEPMLSRARDKASLAGANIRFICADACNVPETDGCFDVIVARNLVWTLPNPAEAVSEWHRLLRPGGHLLIIDGDFVRQSVIERLMPWIDRVMGPRQDGHSVLTPAQWQAHQDILRHLPFGDGLRADDLRDILVKIGFREICQQGLRDVIRARHPNALSRARLIAMSQHRFAISAVRQ